VKVDDDQWQSPPSPGQDVWIVGRIFSNPFGGVRLQVDDFIEPNDKPPAPDEIEQSQGGLFSATGVVGPATIAEFWSCGRLRPVFLKLRRRSDLLLRTSNPTIKPKIDVDKFIVYNSF